MKGRKQKKWIIVLLVLLVSLVWWKVMRSSGSFPCAIYSEREQSTYTETEKVMNAISLSYLVYGCERAEDKKGNVSELLAHNQMGIIEENFGVKRVDKEDASTALIDTAEFIRTYTGQYRFLTDLQKEQSDFYGAAFCDDEKKCVWIAYAGSVSLKDAFSCVGLVLVPGLSGQEKAAFTLFQTVLESEEVKNNNYNIILTGHSLGGALATEVAIASGCEAVTINGADGIAYDKAKDLVTKECSAIPCTENRVSNYMTSARNGKTSFLDIVQCMMSWGSYRYIDNHIYAENGYTNDPHCAFSFIRYQDGAFLLAE